MLAKATRLTGLLVVVAGVAAACAIAAPASAWAQPAGDGADRGRVTERLERGLAQFNDLEYRQAIRTLGPVPRDSAATRAQRVRALELIGLSHLILGEEGPARDAFQDLLAIDPGYQLRDDSGSPNIRAFFDQVKRAYVPGFDPSMTAELDHAAPRGATGGQTLQLDIRVIEGKDQVKEMQIQWRRQGVLDYQSAPARQVDA